MTGTDLAVLYAMADIADKVLNNLSNSDLGLLALPDEDRSELVQTIILDKVKEALNG